VKLDADNQRIANASIAPIGTLVAVRIEDRRSHRANGTQPSTPGKPLQWQTSLETPAKSSETADGARENTTAWGLLKQPDKQEITTTEDTVNKSRKNYTPQEKVAILRRHLIEKQPVSEICDKLNLHPTVFHRWMKEFFENGAAAFQQASNGEKKRQDQQQRRIDKLEEKLKKKDEVMAELLEEHVVLKKSLGEI
jgi:transposase-like protein